MKYPSFEAIVKLYDLQAHPEGGFFRETFRSSQITNKKRSLMTSIYFLLPAGAISHLHRLASDEIWHFYLGGPMTLVQIDPNGAAEEVTLGQDVEAGQQVQHVVPAGTWFGGYPQKGSPYSFVGCDVSPGFDFSEFELASRDKLCREFPTLRPVIERLTVK